MQKLTEVSLDQNTAPDRLRNMLPGDAIQLALACFEVQNISEHALKTVSVQLLDAFRCLHVRACPSALCISTMPVVKRIDCAVGHGRKALWIASVQSVHSHCFARVVTRILRRIPQLYPSCTARKSTLPSLTRSTGLTSAHRNTDVDSLLQ
jgi:hypothetical protein